MEEFFVILIFLGCLFGIPALYNYVKEKWEESKKPRNNNYNQNRSSYNNSNSTTLTTNRTNQASTTNKTIPATNSNATNQIKKSNVDLSDGKLIVDYARSFSEGFGQIRPYGPSTKMFFISKDGKTLLGPYENIETGFSEGLAYVRFGYEDYWYIDKEGNKILGPFKRGCWPGKQGEFHNGYAIIHKKDGNAVIDREGKEIISGFNSCYESHDYGMFSEGLIKLKYDDGFYYVNNEGQKVLGPYEEGRNFHDGLCPIKVGGKWWYIDNKGEKKLGPYHQAYEFVNGTARVDLRERVYAIIEPDGQYAMEPLDEREVFGDEKDEIWDSVVAYITNVKEDFSIVAIYGYGKKYMSLSKDYEDIPIEEDEFPYIGASVFVNGKAIVEDQKKNIYVIDKNGKKLFDIKGEFQVSSDEPFTEDGMVICWNNDNKYGFINDQGEMLSVSSDIKKKIFYNENKPEVDPMAGVNALVSMFDNMAKSLVLQALKNLHENKGKTDEELMAKIQVKKDPTTFRTYYFIVDEESAIHGRINPDTIDAQIEAANKAYDAREAKRLARLSPTPTEKVQNTPIQKEQKIEQSYHVIGVQFDGYKSGCYYYYGDNKIYNIGDRVLVPTGNNGNQEATVVFRKIYTQKSDIPYSGNLKRVIRKINDNKNS